MEGIDLEIPLIIFYGRLMHIAVIMLSIICSHVTALVLWFDKNRIMKERALHL